MPFLQSKWSDIDFDTDRPDNLNTKTARIIKKIPLLFSQRKEIVPTTDFKAKDMVKRLSGLRRVFLILIELMQMRNIIVNVPPQNDDLLADMISLHTPKDKARAMFKLLRLQKKRDLEERDKTSKKQMGEYFTKNEFGRYLILYFESLVNHYMPEVGEQTSKLLRSLMSDK